MNDQGRINEKEDEEDHEMLVVVRRMRPPARSSDAPILVVAIGRSLGLAESIAEDGLVANIDERVNGLGKHGTVSCSAVGIKLGKRNEHVPRKGNEKSDMG